MVHTQDPVQQQPAILAKSVIKGFLKAQSIKKDDSLYQKIQSSKIGFIGISLHCGKKDSNVKIALLPFIPNLMQT